MTRSIERLRQRRVEAPEQPQRAVAELGGQRAVAPGEIGIAQRRVERKLRKGAIPLHPLEHVPGQASSSARELRVELVSGAHDATLSSAGSSTARRNCAALTGLRPGTCRRWISTQASRAATHRRPCRTRTAPHSEAASASSKAVLRVFGGSPRVVGATGLEDAELRPGQIEQQVCAGSGTRRADPTQDARRRLAPVQTRELATDPRGLGSVRVDLRSKDRAPLGNLVDGREQRVRCQLGQALTQLSRRLGGPDLRLAHQADVAGIHLLDHTHDGDTSPGVTFENGPLDRRRPAPARQKARVRVDHPVNRQLPHRLGNELTEGDDHSQIGSQAPHPLECIRVPHLCRLSDREPELLGQAPDGRGLELAAAPPRAIRLANHAQDSVATACQGPQRRQREIRRAEVEQAKGRRIGRGARHARQPWSRRSCFFRRLT